MSATPSAAMQSIAAIAQVATGSEAQIQGTRLGSQRVAQMEQAGFELGRAARSFVGGTTLIAGGVVPVVDLPTTTGPFILFNSNQAGGKLFHIKQISCFYASGTGGAAGFGLFSGITPSVLATPLTSNGATNFRTQCTRGSGAVTGFVDVAKTIAAGTCWMGHGGLIALANTVTGPAYTVDVRHLGLVLQPLFAYTLGVLGDTGTTSKFGFSVAWDEIDGDLP